jgi:hypothetical protein
MKRHAPKHELRFSSTKNCSGAISAHAHAHTRTRTHARTHTREHTHGGARAHCRITNLQQLLAQLDVLGGGGRLHRILVELVLLRQLDRLVVARIHLVQVGGDAPELQ